MLMCGIYHPQAMMQCLDGSSSITPSSGSVWGLPAGAGGQISSPQGTESLQSLRSGHMQDAGILAPHSVGHAAPSGPACKACPMWPSLRDAGCCSRCLSSLQAFTSNHGSCNCNGKITRKI